MTDGRASYVLLGIENQTLVDHAMVARIMIYDALRYYKQLQEIATTHKLANDVTSSEDFVSKFTKLDRLKPVITVVVYYGSKRWDAPCDLFGLFDECYDEFRPLMNNYKIRVFEASTMRDEELQELETRLKCVMTFIKNSDNMEKLNSIIESDEDFKQLDKLSVCVINAVTDSKIQFNETEETVDMCQAIKDMRRISKAEGKAEGEANAKREMALRMLLSGMPLEDIAYFSKLTVDKIKKLDPRELA